MAIVDVEAASAVEEATIVDEEAASVVAVEEVREAVGVAILLWSLTMLKYSGESAFLSFWHA